MSVSPHGRPRPGDGGRSRLADGTQADKDAPVFEALGALDELQVSLGRARVEIPTGSFADLAGTIHRLQQITITVAADLAHAAVDVAPDELVAELDVAIGTWRERGVVPGALVLSGDTRLGCALDGARVAARRAERRITALRAIGSGDPCRWIPLLNRLSDLLFVLARAADAGRI